MINDPLRYVAVPYAELKALLEMARDISKSSPWGQTNTQAWNPDIEQLPELGSNVPTIAGIIGESNTVLISMPDFEAIKQLMPVVGSNNNWWVNGVDTGIAAVPDKSKVLRPPMLIRFPAISAGANQDEILITGGLVTVFNGTDSVVELAIPDTTVNVYNKPMVIIDYQGNVSAVDTTDPILNAVPICYIKHTVHGTVDITNNVTMAISAAELSYYVQTLREIRLTDVEEINTIVQTGVNTINNMIGAVEAEAANKLLGVPRVLSFCHFNDYAYISGLTVAYFKADHTFKFPNNFEGSYAGFTVKAPYVTNLETAVLGIFVDDQRIGSVQFNTDGTSQFVMYQTGYTVHAGATLAFKVDIMTYIGSFSLTLKHTLEA